MTLHNHDHSYNSSLDNNILSFQVNFLSFQINSLILIQIVLCTVHLFVMNNILQ